MRAFGYQGARNFSDSDCLRYIYEGSNKLRFQCCESSRNSLVYLRASQGHTGRQLIAPELMGHIATPYNWKSLYSTEAVLLTSALSWKQVSLQEDKKARREDTPFSSHFLALLVKISDEEEQSDDFSRPRKVHHVSSWKHVQDTAYWVNFSRAKDHGLRFRQTKKSTQ